MNQDQKNIFHIRVNQRQEFDISEEDANALDMVKTGESTYHLLYHNQSYKIELETIDESLPHVVLRLNGQRFEMEVETPLIRKIQELGIAEEEMGSGEEINAPMPGKVLSLLVKEGEVIEAGQDLLILEAMKMENMIKAGTKGVVQEIAVKEGDAVDKNAFLLKIEGE